MESDDDGSSMCWSPSALRSPRNSATSLRPSEIEACLIDAVQGQADLQPPPPSPGDTSCVFVDDSLDEVKTNSEPNSETSPPLKPIIEKKKKRPDKGINGCSRRKVNAKKRKKRPDKGFNGCSRRKVNAKLKEEQIVAQWRRRPNARGRTLNMSEEYIAKTSRMGVRYPAISGVRGARPFLFQTRRGRQILQDNSDSDASSDKDGLIAACMRHTSREKFESREDTMTLAELKKEELIDRQCLIKPDRKKPIG